MTKSECYNTKQKDKILNAIKHQKKDFTIKDIYNKVKNEVGLTTIYRLVDKLVEDGRLSRNIGKNNTTYYQYLEECNNENHFFLKCEHCGKMVHIDCECIEKMTSHILEKHKFTTNKEHIIINGICNKCVNECDKK